jgi:hypothetical protein
VFFPKNAPTPRRLVVSAKPKSKHRYPETPQGKRRRRTNDKQERAKAHEPWLLVTTLTSAAKFIVKTYALRMEIEETFRDNKSHRWGWSLRHARSRSLRRFETLLLIGVLAYAAQLLVGVIGEKKKLHYRYQANTVDDRRVLSLFLLGAFILHDPTPPAVDDAALRQALRHIHAKIAAHTTFVST